MLPEQLFAPFLVMIAMAIMHPTKQMSRTSPKKEKTVTPAKQHVRQMAKMV